jgi:DNA mismatch repair protein MutL
MDFQQENITDYNIPSMVDGYGGEIFDTKGTADDNILVLSSKYIVTAMRSGMLIINTFRAKERIFYEKFLHNLDNSEAIAQQVLFPCTLELNPIQYSLLMESPERLQSLGFDITPTGENSISVNGMPDGFNTDPEAVKEIIDSLISTFEQCESDWLSKAQGRDNMARSLARATALGGQKRLTRTQARVLVDSLFCCAEPEISPSGKKIMEMITEEDLEKRL